MCDFCHIQDSSLVPTSDSLDFPAYFRDLRARCALRAPTAPRAPFAKRVPLVPYARQHALKQQSLPFPSLSRLQHKHVITNFANPAFSNAVVVTSNIFFFWSPLACTANVVAPATGFGPCTVVTARPSGVFSVIFAGTGRMAAPWSTAFIGIMPTCPNTKITLTCGTIPTDYIITTVGYVRLCGCFSHWMTYGVERRPALIANRLIACLILCSLIVINLNF